MSSLGHEKVCLDVLMGDKDCNWFVSSDDFMSAPCHGHDEGCWDVLMGDKDCDWFISSDDVVSVPSLGHEKGF